MYDYCIRNGLIVDGTGGKPYHADICIENGIIAEITDSPLQPSRHEIDAAGKVVSPGFIDIHCHSDLTRRTDNSAENKLYQGVTMELGGNCGLSIVPAPREEPAHDTFVRNILQVLPVTYTPDRYGLCDVNDYARFMEEVKGPIHMGTLVGHNALRAYVVGYEKRDATPEEMTQMKTLLGEMLKQGAFGLSLGLVYSPGIFCKTEELVELAMVVKEHNGMLAVHMRDESDHIFEAMDEIFHVAKRSGVHLHISHVKLMGKANWGLASSVLEKIEQAKQDGLCITADQYPYDASSTGLSRTVPGWAHAGGTEAMLERLRDPALLPKIKVEMQEEIEHRGGADCIRISNTNQHLPEIEDCTLDVIAKLWDMPYVDAAVKILLTCGGSAGVISHSISPEDMKKIMEQRWICVGSDGATYKYSEVEKEGRPHRRSFGTFPVFLETVRESQMMPLEAAVYKITGCPAKALNLKDRGILKPGNHADITIFDFEAIKDRSTYNKPGVKPSGIEYVFVSGEPALWRGAATGTKKGVFIKKGED